MLLMVSSQETVNFGLLSPTFQTLGGSFSLQCAFVMMYCLAAGPMNSDAWPGNETFNIGSP